MGDEQQVNPHAEMNEAIRQRASGGSSLAERREQLARRFGLSADERDQDDEPDSNPPGGAAA